MTVLIATAARPTVDAAKGIAAGRITAEERTITMVQRVTADQVTRTVTTELVATPDGEHTLVMVRVTCDGELAVLTTCMTGAAYAPPVVQYAPGDSTNLGGLMAVAKVILALKAHMIARPVVA